MFSDDRNFEKEVSLKAQKATGLFSNSKNNLFDKQFKGVKDRGIPHQ